ncbi:carboxypeptidase M32 [Oceaniglobus roseus]|uniref:carboxypeptidase M32 n=1 Tax=Oceaniglobus roseus TaxID=1737570 RepID=UPI000C7EE931|nr:carboxypeptidase M32 [Kandeliimicrobium roseum]
MNDFETLAGRVNDVLCAVNALQWDARVMMPPGGAETRGQQIATLKGIARRMILAPEMGAAAEAALEAATTETARRAARAMLEARDHHARIPAELLQAQAESAALANAAWAEARAKADFAIFRPYLERSVALAQQQAAALGYDEHPYDPLVALFEPGETAASLTRLSDRLRAGTRPILDAPLGRPAPRRDFLFRDYSVELQQRFCREIAAAAGYDFSRGRLDTTVHPFEISQTRNDVRITSRWNPSYLPMAIFGTLHETGHALYELGVAPDLTRSVHATDLKGLYAVGGTSFGMHESQSRLVENHVGRSPAFWARHFARLRDTFPEQLGDVTVEEWLAAITHVRPGFIRIEADELTYDLHIMLRVRIEMALLDGSLRVADVPAAWAEAMREDLGLEVPDDGQGCLQDVHWSHNYFGSFPTYTIGNLTAARLFARLRQDERIGAALERADYAPLRAALGAQVWSHGRSLSRAEILERAAPKIDETDAYLAHLSARFAA